MGGVTVGCEAVGRAMVGERGCKPSRGRVNKSFISTKLFHNPINTIS